MEIKRLEGAVEAILFAMGESVELGQIAKAIQQDKPTTEKLLHNLMDKYKDEGRGIQIIELEGSYQLCTKRDYYGCLIRIAMQPKKPAQEMADAVGMTCWGTDDKIRYFSQILFHGNL